MALMGVCGLACGVVFEHPAKVTERGGHVISYVPIPVSPRKADAGAKRM